MTTVCFPNGPLGSNMYLLVIDDGYYIIDPSCDPQIVNKYLNQQPLVSFDSLKAVFMTHAHFDHIMHVDSWKSLFPSVPFYVGKDDLSLLSDSELNCSMSFDNPLSFATEATSFESCNNVISINDTVSIKIINTPGHTNGHVVIVVSDLNDDSVLMFTGDMLFQGSIGRTDFATGSIVKMRESIEKLKNISFDALVLPGHGQSTTLSYEKENNPYFI